MDKESIANLLEEKNQALLTWLENQETEKWEQGSIGKWTTGQHALHLLQSIIPLNTALSMPKFLLRYRFGKASREVRNYKTIINRYQERLNAAQSVTLMGTRNMKVPSMKEKEYILTRLQMENKKLQYKTRKLSDKQLNTLILPHPLMGKMPVREIIMWTAHHTEHHTKALQEKY